MGTTLDQMVDATPSDRDRFMDFLRAASIITVVFGHWLISIISWRGGVIFTTSAIGVTPGLWIATWFFQVMPIFFFVGGFSNLVTYESTKRKGASSWSFVRARWQRLLRPSIAFLVVWVSIQGVMHLADIGAPTGARIWGDTRMLRGMYPPGATLPFGPLWFLAVYMIVVTISPLTVPSTVVNATADMMANITSPKLRARSGAARFWFVGSSTPDTIAPRPRNNVRI